MNLEGREIGGCKLLRKLGAGGMGEVYLAEQRRVGNRHVAVKVVSPDDATFRLDVADDLARRFQREAALLGNLSHPNILPVHDSGVENGLLYLVMEYAPEGSLADAFRGTTHHPLPLPVSVPLAVNIIGQVAAALQYTHDRGVVHRDVKPANVLYRIEQGGHWRMLLADFGVARGMENTSQRTQITGTFAYMAPEQFSGKFSPASDQYALGVMAFQLLTGRLPFEGDLASLTRAHMYDPPPAASTFNPAVPQAMNAVIQRALAKDPAARYPSVAAFADALKAAAAGAGETAETADTTTRPVPPPIALAPTIAAAAPAVAAATAAATSTAARARRRLRPGRVVITLLAAGLLLIGVMGSTLFLKLRQQSTAEATSTVSTSQTATASVASATATSTALVQITPCVGTPTAQQDCFPTPPVPVGQPLLADHSPSCDAQSQYQWQATNFTTPDCPTGSGLSLTSTSPHSLACMNAQGVTAPDGYLGATVERKSGPAVLAFREAKGSGGDTFNITGYYFAIGQGEATAPLYTLYTIDAAGRSHILGDGTISASLASSVSMGIEFKGGQISLYVNGTRLGTFTDSTYSQGYIGVCTGGTAVFHDVQLYSPAS